MSPRSARLLAWSLFAFFLAIVLLTLAVIVFGEGAEDQAFVVAFMGYGLVGALVASRQPGNSVGWLLLAIGLSLALMALVDANVGSESPAELELSAWLSSWQMYVWLTLAAVFLPLVFPDGRLVSRRWRPALWLGVAAVVAQVVGSALKPGRLDVDTALPVVVNPFGVGGAAGDVVVAISDAGTVLEGAAFLVAAASLVVRFRRSRGIERQQLKWFAYVGVLATAGLVLATASVLAGAEQGEGGWGAVVGPIGWFTALAAIVIGIPVACGFAILRHRLYDIDVVINRTLVYGALTATLLGAYLGLVLLLQLALSPLTEQSDLAIAGSTLAVAALFRPARARIQQLVDRRFYRRKYDAAHTIEAFSARLRNEVELAALSSDLSDTVRETMEPAHVSLWLRPSGGSAT